MSRYNDLYIVLNKFLFKPKVDSIRLERKKALIRGESQRTSDTPQHLTVSDEEDVKKYTSMFMQRVAGVTLMTRVS